ncbi:MAG: hypothetical protein II943_08725 [Victivallales bacterium]|nr:hypothetical protein [Victivallales bacterium]
MHDHSGHFLTRAGLKVKLVGRNLEDLRPLLKPYSVQLIEDGDNTTPDLVISHGGDGSLLGAEREYPGIPKFPLRDRRNNPKCPRHEEPTLLKQLFKGELPGDALPKLVATTQAGERLSGLNDIVVSREVHLGAIRTRLYENGRLLRAQVIADGVVFCTAFGSTGYFQSITRGNFQRGIGIAFSNSMDGDSFTILPENAVIELELLRGPASLVADNNPCILPLADGARLSLRLARQRTLVFGLEAFRCQDCYLLRRNGVH